jgi:hypothetical protein
MPIKNKIRFRKINERISKMRKIFASYLSDKGLLSRKYKELQKLNTKRTNDPINKWTSESKR